MPSILDLQDRPFRGKYKPRKRLTASERIARNITVDGNGCWIWTGRLMNSGYGQLTINQAGYKPVTVAAHRASYELAKGRIPEGMVIDHLCRVRECVNPEHLEVVTSRENTMRSPITLGRANAQKTHCSKGHPYDEANTYVYDCRPNRSTTTRICRECQRAYRQRARGRAVAS